MDIDDTQVSQPPYPRYLDVTTTTGYEVRTALIWWRKCGNHVSRVRILGGAIAPYWPYIRAYDNLITMKYQFFFGDGDSEGWDDGTGWPEIVHTGVSFIPGASWWA